MQQRDQRNRVIKAPQEFDEKVVRISRVTKKTKGGNQMSFTALVVIGDHKGRIGMALGKAKDVSSAIKKGTRRGRKNLIHVPLVDNRTLPHICRIKLGAARLILKPAPAGTGVIAGGSVRAILELAGVRDVVAKILGTSNKMSNVTATFEALKQMNVTMATKEALGQTRKRRAVPLQEILK